MPVSIQRLNSQALLKIFPAEWQPFLRTALFRAALVASTTDPIFKAFYQKKRAEGKHHLTCIGAAQRKLCYTIHATKNCVYEIQSTTWLFIVGLSIKTICHEFIFQNSSLPPNLLIWQSLTNLAAVSILKFSFGDFLEVFFLPPNLQLSAPPTVWFLATCHYRAFFRFSQFYRSLAPVY